jgi:hypothetical protein
MMHPQKHFRYSTILKFTWKMIHDAVTWCAVLCAYSYLERTFQPYIRCGRSYVIWMFSDTVLICFNSKLWQHRTILQLANTVEAKCVRYLLTSLVLRLCAFQSQNNSSSVSVCSALNTFLQIAGNRLWNDTEKTIQELWPLRKLKVAQLLSFFYVKIIEVTIRTFDIFFTFNLFICEFFNNAVKWKDDR